MIEFTPDGPFAEKAADPLFPDRVRIVGLGQTGAAVCDQLVLHGHAAQDLWIFDSDQQTIDGSIVPNRHLLGRDLVHGLGCSGDLELAREIVALEESRLAHVALGCDFLILLLGLAGSTGMALAEHLIETGHKNGAKVIVVGVQPFAFEGWARREKSTNAIAQLRRDADSVLVLSHDRIAENPTVVKNVRHGFHLMHQAVAHSAEALAQVVCKKGLIQLSFADVRSLYGRYAGSEVLENCWIGHVEGTINDCVEELIDELLASPLMEDESIWKQADHAIVAVSGTRDLGLTDVQELVNAFKDRMPVNIPIATSASLDEDNHEKIRLTVLLATTAPVPLPLEEEAPAAPVASTTVGPRKAAAGTETVPLPVLTLNQPPVETPMPSSEMPVAQPVILPQPRARKPVTPEPAPVEIPAALEEVLAVEEEEELVPLVLEAQPALAAKPQGARRYQAKQEEMQFEAPTRGRFEKTHETMYRGENLDQPTFRRRGLAIKL